MQPEQEKPFWDIYSNLPQDLQSEIAYDTNLYRVSRTHYEQSWLKRRVDHLYDPIQTSEVIASLQAGDDISLAVEAGGRRFVARNHGVYRGISMYDFKLFTREIHSQIKVYPTHITVQISTLGGSVRKSPVSFDLLITSIPRVLAKREWNYTVDEILQYLDKMLNRIDFGNIDDVYWLLTSYYDVGGEIEMRKYTFEELSDLAHRVYDEIPNLMLMWLVNNYERSVSTDANVCTRKLLTTEDIQQLLETPRERTVIIASETMYLVSLIRQKVLAAYDTVDGDYTYGKPSVELYSGAITLNISTGRNAVRSRVFTKEVVLAPMGIFYLVGPCNYQIYQNIIAILDRLDQKFQLGYLNLCLKDLRHEKINLTTVEEAEQELRSILNI